MAVDLVSGKMGTGKGKFAVTLIREYLREGRQVVTNIDLNLEHLMPADSRATVIRIPDKPSSADLAGVPHGNPDSYEEDRNGLLCLDELGSWLNSRTFQDKDRMPFLDWMIHSRKHGYNCALICQDIQQIDKQARESLVEHVVRCMRFDKVRVPIIGGLIGSLTGRNKGLLGGYLPRMHRAVKRLTVDPKGVVCQGWWYQGDDLHKAYDTRQVFRADYPHGTHSLLSAWHLVGRHQVKPVPWWRRPFVVKPRTLKPKLPIVAALARALPEAERLRHVQRLERAGLLGGPRGAAA